MLAFSEKQLKEYLVEARDHHMTTERRDPKGEIFLTLNYSAEVLQSISNWTILNSTK
jgi:hypothetical protein